ncbi:MAG: aminopeptidase P family protein [Desulfobacteraceae bacterium]|nr:MAG: aminopeptidase P family protein [Desulfobacteraceae bacterium]
MISFLKTPEPEIDHRILTARQMMEKQGLDAMFITHKPDLFYFSGTAQDAYLMMFLDQDPILFVKQYLPRALEESSLKQVEPITSIKEIPQRILEMNGRLPSRCGLAFDVVPHKDVLFYQELFNTVDFADASSVITQCRQIKSSWEIDRLEASARLSKRTFDYMAQTLRPGISEMEFCGMFETFARRHGHSGILLMRHYRAAGYPFHLLSGESGGLAGALDSPVTGTGASIAYPYGAGPRLLRENEPILIDFGTVLDGYHIDETRMFCMGTMPQKAMDACQAAMDILTALVEMMKPGVAMADVYDSCIRHAGQLGYDTEFLGLPELKAKFIGHGTGVELVEAPIVAKGRSDILMPGMVLAMEPKFNFKDQFAAGIESVIHIGHDKARVLSQTDHKVFMC